MAQEMQASSPAEGFFVELTKNGRLPGAPKGKPGKCWKAILPEGMDGWEPTVGNTPEEAVGLQREQYLARRAADQPVPPLVTARESPLASGRMTRFVEI